MRRLWFLVPWLVVGAACGGEDPPTDTPTPGDLVAQLTTPSSQDGALLLRVTGAVSEVRAPGGYRVASSTTGTTTRIVITGNIVGGDLFTLTVPDTRQLSSYSVEIEQVADRDNYALRSPGNYTISLRLK